MILALWAAASLAEPVRWTVDPGAAPFAVPAEGRLVGKDARDAEDRPYDAYTLDAPAGVWVGVTARDQEFPVRVRLGDEDVEFPNFLRDPAVVWTWSEGGPLTVEIGTTDKAVLGDYAVSVAFVSPAASEPPVVDKLPPYVDVQPGAWVDGDWFCDLVTARFAEPRVLTVSAQAEDKARVRVLAGRWDGALHVEAEADASAPLEVRFAAGVPRVFGVCRDRLGKAYLTVRTPTDAVAPGAIVDPSRRKATLDEAAAGEQADLEKRMTTVVAESGVANRYEALVVPLFLQSGLSYEAVVLTETDASIAVAQLYLAYCDATCEAFATRAGLPMTMDGSWYVLGLPDSDETQTWNPAHVERWRFTWPKGTSLTATLNVTVRAVSTQPVRALVGEE